MKNSLINKMLITTTLIMGLSIPIHASELSEVKLDQFVNDAMKEFNIPGIAVGIIQHGEIQHLKGYGVREFGKEAPITADTMYAIASNSKAFTAAAIALLVDDGILDWDDKVIDFLPNFRMMDSWVTAEFTIRDLLTHRSGLGLGAGDLMFWPSTEVSREEIIENIRHLKMVSVFRTEYAYDNTLYVVAGEVV
ncbi:MAG: serine hydrolase, partial [Emcibacteraceae bacterium]|nr:serine hydrolase [Emcibacteraceae bacterium]